jgi:hypothetical protein
MSSNPSKTLIHSYVERVWNRGEPAALEELTLPTFTYQLAGQPARDRAKMQDFIAMIHAAFPDWCVQIVDLIVG